MNKTIKLLTIIFVALVSIFSISAQDRGLSLVTIPQTFADELRGQSGKQIDNAYYRDAYALRSRQVLTSGSSEAVPDQSEFSEALKRFLRQNRSPLTDPISIYNDVRLAIKRTEPRYGEIPGTSHQIGATFLFFRRNEEAMKPPVLTQAPEPASAQSHLEKGKLFFERNDYDLAIEEWEDIIIKEPIKLRRIVNFYDFDIYEHIDL